jgi:soluble lytic murein transglycosylase
VVLVNNGVPGNELSRGIVDYYAGQYGLAIEALDRYLDAGSSQAATAYHYRALSHLAKNEPAVAIAGLGFSSQLSQPTRWPTAWEEKAYAQWAYLERYDEAANLLLEYVQLAPSHGQAPGFLFQAARILERNRLVEAAAVRGNG